MAKLVELTQVEHNESDNPFKCKPFAVLHDMHIVTNFGFQLPELLTGLACCITWVMQMVMLY